MPRCLLGALTWPLRPFWRSFAAANPTTADPKKAIAVILFCIDEYAREYEQL